MENPVKYVTEKEVERLTGFALSTLRNWRFRGKGIPWVKAGRAVRYSLEDVVNFMECRKIRTTEE